jgi:hypothetical protein
MSNQPEENEIEIEEGEIVSETESEEVTETEDEPIDEEIDMDDEDEMMFDDDGMDVTTLMTSLLATEDGDTVCTALVGISQQLQMQNKFFRPTNLRGISERRILRLHAN